MSHITMKEMLIAGLHFGHQTRRWNPKMKPYIFGARNNVYIINLDKTLPLFNTAYDFIATQVAKGKSVLFVGTKQQSQDIIREEASRCGMPYINHRWLGGTLTNFQTIKKSVERMKTIEAMIADGSIHQYKKKEALGMEKDLAKLEKALGGIKTMKSLPDILFVVDPRREDIAIDEASKLGIPVVAITDTNCDPTGIDYVIPGNDDAIRAIQLIVSRIADAALEGANNRVYASEDGEGKPELPEGMATEMAELTAQEAAA